tara:strand:- start:424 stop:1068 length:645 start_codon:yes stop_codon:yes gene_type:complete
MKQKHLICLILLFLLFLFFFQTPKSKDVLTDNIKIDDRLIYIPNFLTEKEYEKILSLDTNKRNFNHERFRYVKPLRDQIVYDIFYSSKNINFLKQRLNQSNLMKSDFPIEHRIYPKESEGMMWHSDTLLYQKPQYEAIYTIRNKSSSLTEWKDDTGQLHSQWTEPNSLLIVKAQGYQHHVTPPVTGEREILKLIYTQTTKTNENYDMEMLRFNT